MRLFGRRPRPADALLGTWVTQEADPLTRAAYGETRLHFTADGTLRWLTRAAGVEQATTMAFRVDGGDLVLSAGGRQERTPYEIGPDGVLMLRHGHQPAHYVRADAEPAG